MDIMDSENLMMHLGSTFEDRGDSDMASSTLYLLCSIQTLSFDHAGLL